jgi:hypothetical protein
MIKRNQRMNLLVSVSSIVVAMALVWSLSATASQETQKALAATVTSTSSAATGISTINTAMLGKPYFEAKGKTIGTRVIDVSNGPPKIEYTFLFGGMMNGLNVTATETALVSFRSNGTGYGVGQGIIMANDGEVATYNGQGYGQTTTAGTTIVHGSHIYSTTSTGKLAFLSKIVGIEEYDLDTMGNVSVKEWAWK